MSPAICFSSARLTSSLISDGVFVSSHPGSVCTVFSDLNCTRGLFGVGWPCCGEDVLAASRSLRDRFSAGVAAGVIDIMTSLQRVWHVYLRRKGKMKAIAGYVGGEKSKCRRKKSCGGESRGRNLSDHHFSR